MIFLDACVVLVALQHDSILNIFLDPVELDACVSPQSVFRENMDSEGVAPPDLVHYYVGVGTYSLDAYFTLNELTQLYLGSAAPLDFDTRTKDVVEQTSQNLGLGVDSLEVNAYQLVVEDLTVLDSYTVVPLRDDVHCSLREVGEPTVRNLTVGVDRDQTGCVILFVAD